MFYKKIMSIGFPFRDEKRGCIVIGGIDQQFSLDKLDIIGKNVVIKNLVDEFIFEVKKVDISTSIAGKINIGLTLEESDDFSKIKIGDEIFIVNY